MFIVFVKKLHIHEKQIVKNSKLKRTAKRSMRIYIDADIFLFPKISNIGIYKLAANI